MNEDLKKRLEQLDKGFQEEFDTRVTTQIQSAKQLLKANSEFIAIPIVPTEDIACGISLKSLDGILLLRDGEQTYQSLVSFFRHRRPGLLAPLPFDKTTKLPHPPVPVSLPGRHNPHS